MLRVAPAHSTSTARAIKGPKKLLHGGTHNVRAGPNEIHRGDCFQKGPGLRTCGSVSPAHRSISKLLIFHGGNGQCYFVEWALDPAAHSSCNPTWKNKDQRQDTKSLSKTTTSCCSRCRRIMGGISKEPRFCSSHKCRRPKKSPAAVLRLGGRASGRRRRPLYRFCFVFL